MTDVEILTIAFAKVKKNGYAGALPTYDENMGQWYVSDSDGGYFVPSILEIIMSHEFATDFWGFHNQNIYGLGKCMKCGTKYMHDGEYEVPDCGSYHLQEMVLRENRVGYLEEFL